MSSARWSGPAGSAAAVAVGWSVFLPIGLKYPLLLGATAWGLWRLTREGRLQRLRSDEPWLFALVFWVWSALTMLWTSGSWSTAAAQVGLYALLLCASVVGLSLPSPWARSTLQHFCMAAGAVGVLCVADRCSALPAPEAWVWRSTVMAEGNQRIVTSLLLALGCALALREAARGWLREADLGRILGWCMVAAAAIAGLATQDRRTGMVTLPVLLAALAMGSAVAQHVSRAKLVAYALAVMAGCAGVGLAIPSVSERFVEGFREVASYNSAEDVNTSWGMRLRMVEQTVQIASERPLVGHGLGSWESLWVKRVASGSMLAEQRTPHNEHLLVAAQTGLVGLALWLGVVWTNATRGLHALTVPVAPATLLVWSAVAWSGLFNVVLRDAKFSVPLLILAALAQASGRSDRDR